MAESKMPVWKVDRERPEADVISQAASIIKKGGVLIYPTETFYGLGGDPMLEDAVERIYRIKGRNFKKPLPLIAADRKAVLGVVMDWPPTAERLAEAFWPGPLTLILRAASLLPPMLHAGTGKIAVRVSSHPVARSLADAAGGLLISTSANVADQPACRKPEEISFQLLYQVDGVLDAGATSHEPDGLPSTIVDLTSTLPRVVRPGRLPWERVMALGIDFDLAMPMS